MGRKEWRPRNYRRSRRGRRGKTGGQETEGVTKRRWEGESKRRKICLQSSEVRFPTLIHHKHHLVVEDYADTQGEQGTANIRDSIRPSLVGVDTDAVVMSVDG